MKPATGSSTHTAASEAAETFHFTGTFRTDNHKETLELSPPSGMAFTSGGNLLVADDFNHRIQIYDPQLREIGHFGGKGKEPGRFHYPKGIAVAADGSIHVADSWNHRVQIFDDRGNLLRTVGEYGEGKGQLNEPHDVMIDPSGHLLVVERYNHRIQFFDTQGQSLGWVGSRGTVLEEELAEIYETPAHLFSEPALEFPTSIATDSEGFHYIADSGNHRIVKFDSGWNRVLSFGGPGEAPGCFQYPLSVAVTATGCVVVTDLNNDRVQAFTRTGKFLFDWSETQPAFKAPHCVKTAPGGELWLGCTFTTEIFRLRPPQASPENLLNQRRSTEPEAFDLPFHLALLQETTGDPAQTQGLWCNAVQSLHRRMPDGPSAEAEECLLQFSRRAQKNPHPENETRLLEGLNTFQTMQAAARSQLLATHREWERAAVEFNRRTFEDQHRILQGTGDPRTFDRERYRAEEADKTLFRQLRHRFFIYRRASCNFSEYLQNAFDCVGSAACPRILDALDERFETLAADQLRLLQTKESLEEQMVQAFGELSDPGGKWESFLVLAHSSLRVLDMIRQFHFEWRMLFAAAKHAARTRPRENGVESLFKNWCIDGPGAETLQKILMGYQEDWNFHPALEIVLRDAVDLWASTWGKSAPAGAGHWNPDHCAPVPFDSEALNLGDLVRAFRIEALPLEKKGDTLTCGGEGWALRTVREKEGDLLEAAIKHMEYQSVYDEKHDEVLEQLAQLLRQKNALDAQPRSFQPQDKKAPIQHQHNLVVVNFQIGLLRRMALTMEINEAMHHARLVWTASLSAGAQAETTASVVRPLWQRLEALLAQLAEKIAAASHARKNLSMERSALDGTLQTLESAHAIADIDRTLETRDRLAENETAIQITEAQLQRLFKVQSRLQKLVDFHHALSASPAPGKTVPLRLHFRRTFGNNGHPSGLPLRAYGLAAGPGNHLIAADYENHQVVLLSENGTCLTRFGHWGNAPGAFRYPIAVATGAAGAVYVADEKNRRVQKFSPEGAFLRAFGESADAETSLGPVFGVSVDAQGRVWVPDPENDRIQVFDAEGALAQTIARSDDRGVDLSAPVSVLCLADGNVLAGDRSDCVLKRLDTRGKPLASLKRQELDCGEIYFMTHHPDHGIFATDYWHNQILHLNEDLELLQVHRCGGREAGHFGRVGGLAIVNGQLFVADFENFRIQVFELPG